MKLIAPHFEFYAGQQAEHTLLAKAFSNEGIEYLPWQATEGDFPLGDAVFWQGISSYYLRMERFEELLQQTEPQKYISINSPFLLRWNSRKTYLMELEQKGIPQLPTFWLERFDLAEISSWAKHHQFKEVIVKPVVSAGAYLTFRLKPENQDSLKQAQNAYEEVKPQPVMVQPFAPEIEAEGEWSFLFFGGNFSHAVLKTPKAGDYRIQHVHGGSYLRIDPASPLLLQAQKVLLALPEPPVYARVDGLVRNETLLLMEVELIEPYFYLDAAPEKTGLLARAVAAAINHKEMEL